MEKICCQENAVKRSIPPFHAIIVNTEVVEKKISGKILVGANVKEFFRSTFAQSERHEEKI